MTCNDLEPLLQPYVDGEIAAGDVTDLESHLVGCPACDERFRQERRERMALRQHLKAASTPAPDSVRLSVQAALQREHRRARTAQITRWGSVTLAVAAASAVAFNARTHTEDRLWEEAALRHSRHLPLEVREPSAASVEGWFDGKLSHPVRLPRLANVTLAGGRLSHLSDRDAAYVAYEVPISGGGAHRVGLFVLEAAPQDSGHTDVRILPSHGYNVATWDGNGLRYQLVTDLDEEQIRQMVGAQQPQVGVHAPPAYAVQPVSLQIH